MVDLFEKSLFLGEAPVSVVIVDYQSKAFAEQLIKSVERHSTCIREIIVVDNNPEGIHLDYSPKIKTIVRSARGNVGFTRGNNLGFKDAAAEYVLFLNPDMVFMNDVAGILLEKLRSDKSIGAIGPQFLNQDGTHQVSTRSFPSLSFALSRFMPGGRHLFKKKWAQYYDVTGREDSERFVDTISTGAFMIRKELFEQLGGFDENTFMYGEDAELCKRIRDRGLRVLYYPSARLLHYGGQSSRLATKIAVFSYYHSFYHLYKKHVMGNWIIVFKPFFLISPWIHLGLMKFKKDKRLTWGKGK